jgi:hypothetical protein
MRTHAPFTLTALLLAGALRAQCSGNVAEIACGALLLDNRALAGELHVVKTHNPGNGPDEQMDWMFDLTAKSGRAMTSCDVGGATWFVPDAFKQNAVPPEEVFGFITYPNGWLATDSMTLRGGGTLGLVQRQHVGDSLPVGVANGIGLVLPGSAAQYTAGITDRTGAMARFPIGTARAIEIAFSPIAEINSTDVDGSGCTVGGEVLNEAARFGMIVGYNVFRLAGTPSMVPRPADFIGAWQYYIPFDSFDLAVPDTLGTAGPDANGDTLPDGDGTPAPSDGQPNDLVGLQNPNGIPYDGDEVLIFQDSWRNPDGTPRATGTGPDLSGATGYWYAFQPVVFQGRTVNTDYDGLGFGRNGEFVGRHSIDRDGDGVAESLDVDLDGDVDFYSPQLASGQPGLGMTNGGLPLLSSPVFGRVNPLIGIGDPRLETHVVGDLVELTLLTGFEPANIVGYDVRRVSGVVSSAVNPGLILARGGEGNVYRVNDRVPSSRRITSVSYTVDVVRSDAPRMQFGPFVVDVAGRRRR